MATPSVWRWVAVLVRPRRVWTTFHTSSSWASASRTTSGIEASVSWSYWPGSTAKRRGAPSSPWTIQITLIAVAAKKVMKMCHMPMRSL